MASVVLHKVDGWRMEGPGAGAGGRVEEGQWYVPSLVLRGHGKGNEEESRGGEEKEKLVGRKEVEVMEKEEEGEVKNFPGMEKKGGERKRQERGRERRNKRKVGGREEKISTKTRGPGGRS